MATQVRAELTPPQRAKTATRLMNEIGASLRRSSSFKDRVALLATTANPIEGRDPSQLDYVTFRVRGGVALYEHRMRFGERRMELEIHEEKGRNRVLKETSRIVLVASDSGESSQVHFSKRVPDGINPDPLNNTDEAKDAIRASVQKYL